MRSGHRAALHGQQWNASQLGASLGLSYHTVNGYLDYLVGAFLIRRLQPYQTHIKKRLVKSSKVYWRDSGVLSAQGANFDAYYFRTSDRHEIDLVLDFGQELWAVEIKLTSSPGLIDMAKLDRAADMIKASRRFLISQIKQSSGDKKSVSCNLPKFLEYLVERGS